MQFTTSTIALFALAKLALADSADFYLHVVRTGTAIHHDGISADGNNLVIKGANSLIGKITDDGFLSVGAQFVGMGPNSELVLVDSKNQATTGWAIQNGYASYPQGYFAVQGQGEYDLFFGTTQDSNQIPFAIWALSTDNSSTTVPDFTPDQKPDVSSSTQPWANSTTSVTQTSTYTDIITITSCDDDKCVTTVCTTTPAPAPITSTEPPVVEPTTTSTSQEIVTQTENGASNKAVGWGAGLLAIGALIL